MTAQILKITLHDGRILEFKDVQKVWELDGEYVVRSVTGKDEARFPVGDVRSYRFENIDQQR